MMEAVFLKIFNMSLHAGILAAVVMLIRLVFRRAPKWVRCILWGMVAIRLVCPLNMESALSLLPRATAIPEEILLSPAPSIDSGAPILDRVVNPILADSFTPTGGASVNPLQVVTIVGANVWILGMIVMLGYMLISYLRVRRGLREAVKLEDGIYSCDGIGSPFILGVIRPKIYLPSELSGEDAPYVIAHERAHLRRLDHLWKPFGFLLLSVYWFHPLLWASYLLLCRDIEYACDEKVIAEMGISEKKPYSEALIRCSMERRHIAACPLAFGEVGVKSRIRSVLNYKKPAFWVIVAAIVICAVTAVCFLTNAPEEGNDSPTIAYTYRGKKIALTETYASDAVTLVPVGALSDDVLAEFYQTSYRNEGGGWLFTIARHAEDALLTEATNHANFEYIGYDDKYWYGIMNPTDVQADMTNAARREEYEALYAEKSEIVRLFLEANPELTAADNEAAYAHAATMMGYAAPIEVNGTLAVRKAVVDYASELVDLRVREYNDYGASQEAITGTSFVITKAEITELEYIPTGTAGLADGVNLYHLEFRMKPNQTDSKKILLSGTMLLEDGWFVVRDLYFAFYVVWSDESETWTPIGVITDEYLGARFGTDEMITRYGDMYTAAAMEMLGDYKEGNMLLFDKPTTWYVDMAWDSLDGSLREGLAKQHWQLIHEGEGEPITVRFMSSDRLETRASVILTQQEDGSYAIDEAATAAAMGT